MIVYNNQAPKAVNNVGQFGATEGSIGAYKSAAEYAADAKYWALLSQTKYNSVEDILAEVERLYAQGLLLEEDIKQLKIDFEAQQQDLLGLIQSTNTAIDNTNAATELSKEATQEVLAQLDIISNMTVQTTLLPPGSMATGSYDNSTGVFSFGIPEGQPGRDGTDGTISDIGNVPVGTPATDDYGFYVDKIDGGLYRADMSDIANLVPSVRSVSINGGAEQIGAVSFNSVSSFNSRTGDIIAQTGDYKVDQITGAAKSGDNSDITSLSGLTSPLSISQGGTGSTTAEMSRVNLGLGSVAVENVTPIEKGGTGSTSASGARTNLGLGSVSTESIVPITKGGTGSTSAENARLALVAAKSGDNSDITSMTNSVTFTQPVSVADAVAPTNAVNLGQLSSDQGASLIGTLDGVPVQTSISNIDADSVKLKLNWAIEKGYTDVGFTFAVGGTLTTDDRDKVVYDPVSKTWYSYSGALPITIPAGFDPISSANWEPQTGPGFLCLSSYDDLRSYSGSATHLYVKGCSSGDLLAGGWFSVSSEDATSSDDDGTILVDILGRRWVRVFNGVLLPEWFGADPSGISDCTSAFNKCFASAKGKEVRLGGKYKFLSSIVVDYNDQYSLKVVGIGSSNHGSNAKEGNYCYLDFDDIPEGSRALTFKGVRGLTLNDFHISHRKISSSISMALWITQLDNFKIDGVTIDSNSGPSGQGIRFGESGGEDCAFMGSVSNCKVWMHGGGPAFAVQPLCTSITLKNCYQIGGYYYFQGCIYMSVLSCASEGSQVNGYGYVLYGVKGLTAINCAGEGNKNGVFYISNGSSNVEILSPFGSGNNSGNTAIPGALVYVDGSGGYNANIHIANPVSENQGSNTQNDIGFSASNINMSVSGVYAQNLSKGIGGSDSWAASNLSINGDLSQRNFTFTTSGFTVSSPVMSGKYVRNGKKVDFSLSLSGSAPITTTLGSSFIQLPFGSPSAESVCSVVSNTGTSFGNAIIGANGNIYLPTNSGATGFVVSGFIITE